MASTTTSLQGGPDEQRAQELQLAADERDLGTHARAVALRARDLQAAVERADAVGEPAQPRPALRVGAADPVGDDLDDEPPDLRPHADGRRRGLRVLADVREALGDDEVRRP